MKMEPIYYIALIFFPALIDAGALKHLHQNVCGPTKLTMAYGVIMSPNYPQIYPNFTSCSWVIVTPPHTILTISVTDFDIEEDVSCNLPPCCRHTWLSLPAEGGHGEYQQFCGRKTILGPITVQQENTFIKFHTSKVLKGGRGFHLKFATESAPESQVCPPGHVLCNDGQCSPLSHAHLCDTEPAQLPCQDGMIRCGQDDLQCFDNATQRCNGHRDCLSGRDEMECGHGCLADEIMCLSGDGCYRAKQKCDTKRDCVDFSDEADCDFCGIGQALCSSTDGRCFSPRLEQCNGKFECPLGEDELGCSKECPELACSNGDGCYSQKQRCDSVPHCRDSSDETDCPACTAAVAKFLCDNGRCIADRLWCNDNDDCGDRSDERACLGNSVVTAAIMGSLVCGLLLVIAVGCMCRVYGLRVTATRYQIHTDALHRVTRQAVLRPDEEFFHREPPPAYSVAVSDSQQLHRLAPQARLFSVAAAEHLSRSSHRSRSARRHTASRRRSQRSVARNTSPPHSQAVAPAAEVRETSLEDKNAVTFAEVVPSVTFSSMSSSSTSSATDSPSRGSMTSSTSVMSCNDDVPLIIV